MIDPDITWADAQTTVVDWPAAGDQDRKAHPMTLATHSTLDWVLIILALIAFALAVAGVKVGARPVNLTAAGLFLLTLTLVTT